MVDANEICMTSERQSQHARDDNVQNCATVHVLVLTYSISGWVKWSEQADTRNTKKTYYYKCESFYGWIDGCLLLKQARTAEQIWVKFGTDIYLVQNKTWVIFYCEHYSVRNKI